MRAKKDLEKGYLSRHPNLLHHSKINFDVLAKKTHDYSGADIKELCSKAAQKLLIKTKKQLRILILKKH